MCRGLKNPCTPIKGIMKHCLNLGSGRDYKKSDAENNWVNVDHSEKVNPDIVADIEDRLPFEDDTFDYVLISHVWEHCEDLIHVMEEIWRVCKPGAKVHVDCPYYTHLWSWGDPTHKHAISEGTFKFLSYECYKKNAEMKYNMSQLFPKCDFDYIISLNPAIGSMHEYDNRSIRHYWNIIEEIKADMTAVKPLRTFDLKDYQ